MMCSAKQPDNKTNGGSGESNVPEPQYLAIGKVRRPHGVLGELRVSTTNTDDLQNVLAQQVLYLASPHTPDAITGYEVERARLHKNDVLLVKLTGCDDRNAAEAFRDMIAYIAAQDTAPLLEGEYYFHQIIGMQVETEEGMSLGHVVQILQTGANDVYMVEGACGEILIPAIEDVVRLVDVAVNRMTVRLLPGMLPEER